MRKVFQLFLIVSVLLAPQIARSQSFVEGAHYSVLETSKEPQVNEVVEYFSFSCPGCYALEPHIISMLNAQPSLSLRRVHMPFGGAKAKLSQKAFVLMSILGNKEHKDAIFRRIHVDRDVFDSDQELVQYFVGLGYAKSLVEETLKSFTADTMIRKMNKEAREHQIKSVPTLIVNGKYKINTRAIYSGASLSALVQYLSSKT